MDDIIKLQRATVDEHIRHENAHDWPAVHATFVQDERAFYDVIPLHAHFAGLNGVKDFYQAAQVAFPDFTIDVWGEYDLPGCSVREVTIAGTHQGDWCGVSASGRRVKFHLLALFLFKPGDQSGKLLAERIYFDNHTVLRQIGGEESAADVPAFLGRLPVQP